MSTSTEHAPAASNGGRASADPLGERMKDYERATRTVIPPRQHTVLRLDGKAWHTWTRGLERPFSERLVSAMGETLGYLCEEVDGVALGYTQSDEITLVLAPFGRESTQTWYGGGVQKMVSVSASAATAFFARLFPDRGPACFDARVFTLPDRVEVANNLLWRQRDARRNAISMVAETKFSPRQLHGKSTAQRREMLADAGVDLSSFDARFMNGQMCVPVTVREYVEYVDKRTGETRRTPEPVERRRWELRAAREDFTADPDGMLLGGLLAPDPA